MSFLTSTLTAAETITWETATDWDNSVSEAGVVHEAYGDLPGSGTIALGYPRSLAPSGTVAAFQYHAHDSSGPLEDISGNARDGALTGGSPDTANGMFNATCVELDGIDDNVDSGFSPNLSNTGPGMTIFGWFRPLSSGTSREFYVSPDDGGFDWTLLDGNSSGGNNGLWTIFNGSGPHGSVHTIDINSWQHIVATWDTSANEVRVYKNGAKDTPTTTLADESTANTAHIGSLPSDSFYANFQFNHVGLIEDWLTDAEAQSLYFTSGLLTAPTKSFSTPRQPDLDNLSYTLNGQSIDLDVIGSPGTGSEETVTQSLGGASSYPLTWGSDHTDFRIEPNLSTTDETSTPTFSAGSLVG